MWRLEDILEAVNGTIYKVEEDLFTDISTDSRTIKERELFIPITGTNFDGHLFMREAYERSRAGVLCDRMFTANYRAQLFSSTIPPRPF
jgi:UDP-N-acetylmuramoyl-tripeptide--D-alanyl-D-alanine ligase